MEAWGLSSWGGLGVTISRRLDAYETYPVNGMCCGVGGVQWCGRATGARRRKKDRRDHVRGARRSRTRGPSSRVDRSSAALGRGLFFPTRFFLVFCLPARRRRRREHGVGAAALRAGGPVG